MIADPLAQILLLLASAVGVVALARRVGLPAILGYLFVGITMGPYALGLVDETEGTRLLAELGVVFLLFTLGLEFSWPRMVAMRREVFGVGSVQMLLVAGCASLASMPSASICSRRRRSAVRLQSVPPRSSSNN